MGSGFICDERAERSKGPMRVRATKFSRAKGAARRGGFVLLEVIISLTILAVTVTAVLRSFSQSFSAARQLEVITQAAFFAQQLLDEFEINPPEEGENEGGFGDDYIDYYYIVDVEYEAPDYDETNRSDEIRTFFPLRRMRIDIYYDNGRNKAMRAISLDTAIMGFERFSSAAKLQLRQF